MIKNKLNIKFHSEPIYEQKYLKAKVRKFDGVIKTNFLGNDMPKENMHYTCIACIAIHSVMRIDKKNPHPQVYLKECKYRVKKMQMSRFINTELKSDSDSELDSEKDISISTLYCRDSSIFYLFIFICVRAKKRKNANKRIRYFFLFRCFLSAFFILV